MFPSLFFLLSLLLSRHFPAKERSHHTRPDVLNRSLNKNVNVLSLEQVKSFPPNSYQDFQFKGCKGEMITIRESIHARHLQQLKKEFEDDGYGICNLHLNKVLDIGGNVGAFALQVLLNNPNVKIYSLEPLPVNQEYYKYNMKINKIDPDRVVFIGNGISSDGRSYYVKYNTSNSFSSQRYDNIQTTNSGVTFYNINTTTLDRLLYMIGPIDLLKMDCEGCEYEAMFSSKYLLNPSWVRIIKGEAHGPWKFKNANSNDLITRRTECFYKSIAANKEKTGSYPIDC